MGYRRSPETLRAERRWRAFLVTHSALLLTAGLPSPIVSSQSRWDDFLMHGHLDHHDDPTAFSVEELDAPAYAALRELAESYFAAGNAFFTPFALRADDQVALRARFAAST